MHNQIGDGFWVHQHVKVTRFEFVYLPARLLRLRGWLFVRSTALDVHARCIRPAIKYRDGLHKETKSARTNFGDHLPAQRFLRDDFLQIVKAPGRESFSPRKLLLELLSPFGIFRFHQVESAGPIGRNARIHKYVGVDRICKLLPDGREQRARAAMSDERKGCVRRNVCKCLRNGLGMLFPERFFCLRGISQLGHEHFQSARPHLIGDQTPRQRADQRAMEEDKCVVCGNQSRFLTSTRSFAFIT